MAAHAKLSASGSKQWMACPGSVAAEARNPAPRGSSIFAMEGTAAHLLCELFSGEGIPPSEFLGDTIVIWNDDAHLEKDLSKAKKEYGKGADDLPIEAEFVVDQDMIDAVEYFCLAVNMARERLDPRGREEFTEKWIDMTWLHPLLGGTGDFIAVEAFGWAELIDYKHGRGVLVEVFENTQLKIYATGILHMFPDCEGVRMTIVQPRKEHEEGPIRFVEYTRKDLEAFAVELKEAAEATQRPNAMLAAGDHCTWCDAKAYTDETGQFIECQALKDKIQEEAGMDFDDVPPAPGETLPTPTSSGDLARAMRWLGAIDGYVKAVEGAVQRELLAGRPVPGQKLVRKRANRRFGEYREEVDELTGVAEGAWHNLKDEEIVEKMIDEVPDLKAEDCYSPGKLKSPAQFEKMGKAVKEAVGKYAYKPEGGLTVASEDDPRPAVEVAAGGANDFPDDL